MLCILYETSLHSIYKFISNYIAKQGQNLAGVNYTRREKGNIIKISDNVENGENLVYNKSYLYLYWKMFIIVYNFYLDSYFFLQHQENSEDFPLKINFKGIKTVLLFLLSNLWWSQLLQISPTNYSNEIL